MALIESHYEINVSHKGKHFFATADRSCKTHGEMLAVYDTLFVKFPMEEGYHISVTRVECVGQGIHIAQKVEA